jgi:uncharacterized ferritin-like protein (DUF455 family)
MASYFDYAREILLGERLEQKLINVPIEWDSWREFSLPSSPGRKDKLSFSETQMKFPKAIQLNETDKKALALHSFANHELLAMEMMAAALLIYPHKTEEDLRFKKGIVTALKDEQKHLQLYIRRMNELGYEFGDFPLNDFFWRQMEKLTTPSQYLSVMALTFESANLDFAQFYRDLFKKFGDDRTAEIMDIVLEDEISHVAFGAHWMKNWKSDKTLWDYYRSSLPWPVTPARSKGIEFDRDLHLKAVSDSDFVENLSNYNDDFKVTRRPKAKV